jgi:predicted GTPase
VILRSEDVLIAVVGATGCGKTSFISTLFEEDVGIDHGLKSGKGIVQSPRIHSESVV